MNAMTKAMKSRIQTQRRTVVKSVTPILDTTRTIVIALSPTSIANVLAHKGINVDEVRTQIKDLIYTNSTFRQGEKINLSQVCDCGFDLLFSKQEKNENNITESYFCIV